MARRALRRRALLRTGGHFDPGLFPHGGACPSRGGKISPARGVPAIQAGLPPAARVPGPGGKPRFPGGQPAFSISHAGAVAVCAFSEGEVSADVERVAAVEPPLLSVLQPEELACLRRFPEAQQARIFYQLWTQKESLIKARGGVLADVFGQESVITPDLRWKDRLGGFFLRRPPFPEPEYVLAVSAEAEEDAVLTRLELPHSAEQLQFYDFSCGI